MDTQTAAAGSACCSFSDVGGPRTREAACQSPRRTRMLPREHAATLEHLSLVGRQRTRRRLLRIKTPCFQIMVQADAYRHALARPEVAARHEGPSTPPPLGMATARAIPCSAASCCAWRLESTHFGAAGSRLGPTACARVQGPAGTDGVRCRLAPVEMRRRSSRVSAAGASVRAARSAGPTWRSCRGSRKL